MGLLLYTPNHFLPFPFLKIKKYIILKLNIFME